MKSVLFHKAFLSAIILTAAVSCIRDDMSPSVGPGETVEIVINTDLPGYSAPASRALADENGTEAPMVLVFTGNDKSTATFTQAARSVYRTASDGTVERFVTLVRSSAQCHLLLVFNPPGNKYFDGAAGVLYDFSEVNLRSSLTGKTFREAVELLRTPPLDDDSDGFLTGRPFAAGSDKLPMAGYYALDKIDHTTVIGTAALPVNAVRSVAKVWVTVDPVLTDFTVQYVGVIEAHDNGTFYRDLTSLQDDPSNRTDYLSNRTDNGITGMAAAVSNSTENNPLYLYESDKNAGTMLVMKGTLGGQDYFYKMAFVDGETLLDIVRNTVYKFTVKSISPGYGTLAEAIAAPAGNIYYEVVTGAFAYEIISNEKYYMALSNSSVLVYDDSSGEMVLEEAVVVTTDALAGDITPGTITCSGGVTLVFPASGQIDLATAPGNIGETKISVKMAARQTSGTIELTLGEHSRTIEVQRFENILCSGIVAFPHDDYVRCEITSHGENDWLAVSIDGLSRVVNDITLVSPTTLSVVPYPNLRRFPQTGGELYLARASNPNARIKVYLTQERLTYVMQPPANSYIVHPEIRTVIGIPVWDQVGKAMAGVGGGIPVGGIGDAVLPADWLKLNGAASWGVAQLWSDVPIDGNNSVAEIVYMGDMSQDIDGVTEYQDVVIFPGYHEGNTVVILFRDMNGDGRYDPSAGDQVVWSWHIWNTRYNPDITGITKPSSPAENRRIVMDGGSVYLHHTGYARSNIFMDRNLGAANVSLNPDNTVKHDTDAEKLNTCGLLYQHGRKDPVCGAFRFVDGDDTGTDSYDRVVYNDNNELVEMKYEGVTVTNNLINSIVNPFVFYTNQSEPWGWYTNVSEGQNMYLWGGGSTHTTAAKTVFDPCPPGWKVPDGSIERGDMTYSPWMHAGLSVNTQHLPYSDFTSAVGYRGYSFDTYSYYNLGWYPASGFRDGLTSVGSGLGRVNYISKHGSYHTANTVDYQPTPSSTKYLQTNMFYFRVNAELVSPNYMIQKANGAAIRCVAE